MSLARSSIGGFSDFLSSSPEFVKKSMPGAGWVFLERADFLVQPNKTGVQNFGWGCPKIERFQILLMNSTRDASIMVEELGQKSTLARSPIGCFS